MLFIISVIVRIQIYDDDGKKGPDGKDQLIGSGFFSLKELEAGSIVNTKLPLIDGKRSKSPGNLLVRSYKEHQTGGRLNYNNLTVSAICQELVDHRHSTQQALATLPSLNPALHTYRLEDMEELPLDRAIRQELQQVMEVFLRHRATEEGLHIRAESHPVRAMEEDIPEDQVRVSEDIPGQTHRPIRVTEDSSMIHCSLPATCLLVLAGSITRTNI